MFQYDLQHWGKEKHIILFISVRARSTEFLQYITVLIWMSWQNCHSNSGFLHADLRTGHWKYANSVHINTMWFHGYSRCVVVLTASGADLWVWFGFSCLHSICTIKRWKKKNKDCISYFHIQCLGLALSLCIICYNFVTKWTSIDIM